MIEKHDNDTVWKPFEAYIAKNHAGIKDSTLTVYKSQIRRILREVPDMTKESLNTWLMALAPKKRTPYRAAWKYFCRFYLSHFGITLADFRSQAEVTASRPQPVLYPPHIVEWLRHCAETSKIPLPDLMNLTTTLDTGPRFNALAKSVPGLASGELVLVAARDGKLVIIPAKAYKDFVAWGDQGPYPVITQSLIPHTRGASRPMSIRAMRDLLAGQIPEVE